MNFFDALKEQKYLIFDGAMGTILQTKGLAPGIAPEEWNLENSEAIYQVHKSYVDSGVDIIETNTFGGNTIKLAMHGLGDKLYEVNYQGAQIAKKASMGKAYVAGNIGPSGKLIKPLGDVSEEELYDAFKSQALALATGGVDLFNVETMSCLTEAKIALQAIKENTNLPVIAMMSFESGRKTMMGIGPAVAVQELEALGVDVIGANCGLGPKEMLPIIEEMLKIASVPVMAQPNAGLPKLVGTKTVFDQTPVAFANYAKEFLELGVKIFGGCCGTTPAHMAAVVKLVK
ncbi:MAG: homocysteine S-methyltransferase family protein [Bacillota bacterium]|nr:homocysteine S-methyltransferase family protein [Bacillota bacterium]